MISGSSSLRARLSILSPNLIGLESELEAVVASLSSLQMTALDWTKRLLGTLTLFSHSA